ncbi:hypothetical protein [Anaeromyxobacter diazotrophicus]|uniref:Uncharacterized protein n=1 Tax=Anaeromyxobacter diazotrophicus TaxID=2590199 RepID=A0A7I9VHM6_9BACT|nr:hypothetical protein [Anaeromyxobacter diazotrophicus]GEJ55894.1 hypothetical protein AMYX_06350 [Anaeromyxobacter diazotrophicus]
MDAQHQHPPEAACPPTCPGWSEGALQLFALQRRYADMLAACQAAEAVESIIVNPATPGVELPEYLGEEQLVRLNLVVGRDTPELLMDDWGLRCSLTFRGRRLDCAVPWDAILAGVLRAPPRRRPRFQVIAGGKKDDGD